MLQLSWVSGGVIGLLIGGVWSFGHDSVYSIGFAVITVLLLHSVVDYPLRTISLSTLFAAACALLARASCDKLISAPADA